MLIEAGITPGASRCISDFTRTERAKIKEYLRARAEAGDG